MCGPIRAPSAAGRVLARWPLPKPVQTPSSAALGLCSAGPDSSRLALPRNSSEHCRAKVTHFAA
jgi:hypothetical protein